MFPLDDIMNSDHRIASWQGVIGVLTNNNPFAACTWTLDILMNGFRGAGIEVPHVVAEALLNPACDVFELCEAIKRHARSERAELVDMNLEDLDIDLGWVDKLALYLGATTWTLQYLCEVAELMRFDPYIEVDRMYMWAKAFRRDFCTQKASWTDGQISDLLAMHQVDVWDYVVIMESDILALGYLMGTMSEVHATTCRPLLERCLIKLAWMEAESDIFEDTARSTRVYNTLDAGWWSPDAVLVGFKDMLFISCFRKCGYAVTFPPNVNLGYGRLDIFPGLQEEWNDPDGIPLPTTILAATVQELKKRERVMALRRAYSTGCLAGILTDVLKTLHEKNGGDGNFWVASQNTYDVIHAVWNKVLTERYFIMFHSVRISKYLPFMRQFRL